MQGEYLIHNVTTNASEKSLETNGNFKKMYI
jgi:hypothetical protein